MAMQGLIPLEAALPMILGTNVGTCITALFASIGTTLSARRAAFSHVTFNVLGATLFLIFLPQFESLVVAVSPAGDLPRQVANAHTLFSVITTAIFLPFINQFVKLITRMVPGEEADLPRGAAYLNWSVIGSPSAALPLAQQELLRMAALAGHNVQLSMEAFFERDPKKIKLMREQEEIVDELEKEISRYLAKVSQVGMSDDMSARHTELLYAANDIERVSDHADNISELAEYAIDEKIVFSDEALEELRGMYDLVMEAFEAAVQCVRDDNSTLVPRVKELEDMIDEREEALRMGHTQRLKEGRCSAENGVVFLDIISNLERIGDHANNISDVPQDKRSQGSQRLR